MAIPTSRTSEAAEIFINTDLCIGCGLCVEVCKDFSLIIKDEKACLSNNSVFGCIGCGHCMAVCPEGAIKISGRFISSDDLISLPEKHDTPSYESLIKLLTIRRSIREFCDIPVERSVIDKVLDAAQTAPMGLPPSDVNVLVFRFGHLPKTSANI